MHLCILFVPLCVYVSQRFATAVEAQLNSVDRLQEYSTLPQEAPPHLPSDDQLPSDWPQAGRLHFKHLSLRYRPELPQVGTHTMPR